MRKEAEQTTGTGWERGLKMELRNVLEVVMSLLRVNIVGPRVMMVQLKMFQLSDGASDT